jgi:20S proteasome subunit alpha 2
MELEDAVHTAILTLKEGYEGIMEETGIEIGIARLENTVTRDGEQVKLGTFKKLSHAEIKDYLSNL